MSANGIDPYKGLRPFEDTTTDVGFFFGRDRDCEIIASNLVAARLTVLYGETGVGKSSVLRAGVAHQLRSEARARRSEYGSARQAVCVFDAWRDDDPVDGLARAVEDEIRDTLDQRFEVPGGGASLADRLEACAAILGGDIYVVLDQTEEFFLYHEDEGERSPFVEQLADVIRRPGLHVNVLLSLREDAVAKLDRFKGPIPNVLGNYLRLAHLDRAAGRDAIVGPIDRYNALTVGDPVEIEDALVDAVLYEVAAGRFEIGQAGRGVVAGRQVNGHVETPYLQLVMQRLWDEERRTGSRVLRLSTLRYLGGSEQIVHDHLDQAMRTLSPGDKVVAASVFGYLVTPSGTKIAHGADDLARYAGANEAELQSVLTKLTSARILRPVAADGQKSRYEIYHDVLGGAVLAWRTSHQAERELVSERERARARHRRLMAVIVVGAMLLAVMAGITAYALSQRSEAERQAARAKAFLADALAAKTIAERQTAIAHHQTDVAEAETERALQAEQEADRQTDAATAAGEEAVANQQIAEQNAAEAEAAEEQANKSELEAEQSEQRAEEATKSALTEKRVAELARAAEARAADMARARALAARSLALVATRPLEALRLALSAASREATQKELAENVLRTSLAASKVRAVLPGAGGPVMGASFSPDGRLALTVARRATLFNSRTGERIETLADPAAVRGASFSPDSRFVVTAGSDGTARIWPVDQSVSRLLTGAAPTRLQGHASAVVNAVFSRSGGLVATSSDDRTARVWNAATGQQICVLQHEGPVQSAAFSPDEKLVVTVSRVAKTGRLVSRLFDATSGTALQTFEHGGVRSAIFSPDGSSVVTTGNDDFTRIWSLGGERRATLEQDEDVVTAAFNADGTRLVTASEGGAAYVWQFADDAWIRALVLVGPLNLLTGASFSPDGRFIVVTSLDRTTWIYRATSGLPVAVLAGHGDGVVASSFAPDGRSIISASKDGTARIWEPGTQDLLELVGKTNDSPVRRASFSPDGRLAVSAGADGTARILDVARRAELRVLRHDLVVNDAEFSPDGKLVVTASDDATARIWRVNGDILHVLPHDDGVLRATFSSDGTRVATASEDHVVRIWRTKDGSLLHALSGHTGAVLDVAFSADGQFVASAGDATDRTARIWSAEGDAIHVLRHQGSVPRVSFSPDSRLVLTASSDRMARLWSVSSGELVHQLRGHTQSVRDAEFSPDGTRVVTASDDRDARIWGVSTGRSIQLLRGHFRGPQTASFSPDGRWVVTTGRIAAGIWDATTGRLFAPTGLVADPFLRGHSAGPLTSAVFSPDSRRILTAGGDGTVRTFVCVLCGRTQELIRIATARLSALEKHLTASQRRSYLNG